MTPAGINEASTMILAEKTSIIDEFCHLKFRFPLFDPMILPLSRIVKRHNHFQCS